MDHNQSLLRSVYISLCCLLLMLVLYAMTAAGYFGTNPVGQSDSYEMPLIVPAGYAFSIWSVIYTGLIAFPVYQLIRRRQGSTRWKKIHFWYSANVLANGLWLVCASYDWLWITVMLIVFLLISLHEVNQCLKQLFLQNEKVNFWLEHAVFIVYFAWVTLATVLNIASALTYYEWGGWGLGPVTWSLIILPVTALVAGYIFLRINHLLFALVVVWAFIGIAVRHVDSNNSIAIVAGGIAAAFLMAGVMRIKLQ